VRSTFRWGQLGTDLLRELDEGARGRPAVPVTVPHSRDRAGRDVVELDNSHAVVLVVDSQARDDGGAEAGRDHPLHGAVVVGAEDEAKRLG
jgi:hypothetical protein